MSDSTDRTLASILTRSKQQRLADLQVEPAKRWTRRTWGVCFPIVIRAKPDITTDASEPRHQRGFYGLRFDVLQARMERSQRAAGYGWGSASFRNDEGVFQALADQASASLDGDEWTHRWAAMVEFAQRHPRTNRRLNTNANFDTQRRG